MGCSAFPNDFVAEIFFPEHFVQQYFYIVTNMVIQMHIDGCRFAHDGFYCHEVFIHPAQVFFFIPHIPVHLFLERFQVGNVQFLLRLGNGFRDLGIPADIHLFGVVCPTGKGRVDINQINLNALLFEVGTGRNAFPSDNQVALRIFAYRFLLLHLI